MGMKIFAVYWMSALKSFELYNDVVPNVKLINSTGKTINSDRLKVGVMGNWGSSLFLQCIWQLQWTGSVPTLILQVYYAMTCILCGHIWKTISKFYNLLNDKFTLYY